MQLLSNQFLHVDWPAEKVGMFVVWLRDAKLQNLLSGRRANIEVTVEVAFMHRYPKLLWDPYGNRQHDIA